VDEVGITGIRYPVALDSDMATWNRYNNRFWPGHYLIDKQGRVVYTHFGEGHYDITENNIRYLLGLTTPAPTRPEPTVYRPGQTPETYLGYDRADSYGGKDAVQDDATAAYHLPDTLPGNRWALNGKWHVDPEKISVAAPGATLRIHFTARKVFLVLGTARGTPGKLTLTLNGFPVGANAGRDVHDGTVSVTRHALYELVDQKTLKSGVLDITTDTPGLEAYAFTFGG